MDAIERFQEALKEYVSTEVDKKQLHRVDELKDVPLTPAEILAVANELSDLNHQVELTMTFIDRRARDLQGRIKSLGIDPPPATILDANAFNYLWSELQPSFDFPDKTPRMIFAKDLFEVDPEKLDNYETAIDDCGITAAEVGTYAFMEDENATDARMGLMNTGIKVKRRVLVSPITSRNRPPGKVLFKVTDQLEHLNINNINLLRANLGKMSTFTHLPVEILATDIKNLYLDGRTYNCLLRRQVTNIGSLLSHTEEGLSELRNFGESAFHELLIALASNKILPEVPDLTNQ